MADVITRFKLETTQYDSKLRDSVKGLKEAVKTAELAGKDFKGFEKNTLEAAKALGTIETGANNSKDKVKELVGAFNDMAKTYNTMSQEIRDSDVGQAISQSLTQLSGRIKEAKEELYSLGETAKSSDGLFGGSSFTDMLSVAGGNLIASGIQKIGSEMAETIQQSIELARQGEGVRIAFERLNKPGLLDNLKEATHGTVSEIELMKQAIKFENFKLPLEDLATYLAFAQQKAKDTGESIDFLVTSIVNGLGRQSKQILDNLGISAAELTKRMAEGADMTKAVADIIREEMEKAGDYVETAADRAARASAQATDKMEALGQKAIPVAEEWSKVWNEISIGGMDFLTFVLNPIADSLRSIRELLNGEFKFKADIPNLADGPQSPWAGWKPGTDHTVKAPGGYVEVTDSNTGAVIGGQHFDNLEDSNAIKAWQKSLFKTTSTKGSKKKESTIDDFNKILAKSMNGSVDLKETKDLLSPYEMMLPEIKKNILDIKDADLGGSLAKLGDKKVTAEIAEINKQVEQQHKAFDLAAQSAANLGNALASIDDPGAKAAGTVLSAIANIALGFSQAAATASSLGPYGWIAYLAAGTAAMATTISTIHSLTGYQNGGMIKGYSTGGTIQGKQNGGMIKGYSTGGTIQGNSYSGDRIGGMVDGSQLVGLNAGELVLNKAQQATLAQNLQGGGNIHMTGEVTGEKIVLVADRWGMRTGRGELLFGKNL